MIAVDTSVVVRLLTEDSAKQFSAARILFELETIWIAKTVLLETEWVLRSVYDFNENAIHGVFTDLV